MSDKVTQLINLLTNFDIQIIANSANSGEQHQFFSSEFSSSTSLRYQQHRNLGSMYFQTYFSSLGYVMLVLMHHFPAFLTANLSEQLNAKKKDRMLRRKICTNSRNNLTTLEKKC